ncbi:hypothetical protein ACMA5I_10265 [Paracoccaceae bacterium GXU_MW_L88]
MDIKRTEQLLAVRNEIAELKEKQDIEMKPLKDLRDNLQEELIEDMKENGMRSVKTEHANFSIASRKGYAFVNEVEAMKWATEHRCTTIDKTRAAQELKKLETLPDFVEPVENEYISIKPVTK